MNKTSCQSCCSAYFQGHHAHHGLSPPRGEPCTPAQVRVLTMPVLKGSWKIDQSSSSPSQDHSDGSYPLLLNVNENRPTFPLQPAEPGTMKSPGVVSRGATSLRPHKGEGRGRRTSWHCQSVSTHHQQRPWHEGKPLTKDNLIQFYNSCSWILCSKYTVYVANVHHHAFTKSRERTREWLLAHKCALGAANLGQLSTI